MDYMLYFLWVLYTRNTLNVMARSHYNNESVSWVDGFQAAMRTECKWNKSKSSPAAVEWKVYHWCLPFAAR